MRTTTLISLIYSVLGTAAYLMTVIAVVRLGKKTFSTAFISIYVIAAIVNLATHVNTWIMYRLRFEPAFGFYYEWMMQPEMELPKDIQQFLVSYFYFAQNACAFLFTLNRFTAIYFIALHRRIWNYHIFITCVVHLISFGVTLATRWPAKADFVYNIATQVYDLSSNPKTSLIPVMIAMVSYGAVMLLLCSIMSMVSVSSLWNIHFSRIERNMTIIVLAVFAAQAANIVIVILNSISVFTRNWTTIVLLSDVLPFMSDLFSLGPAAYTLLLPGPIREYYTRLFSRRSEMITSVTML